jgi:hypothetical protein
MTPAFALRDMDLQSVGAPVYSRTAPYQGVCLVAGALERREDQIPAGYWALRA